MAYANVCPTDVLGNQRSLDSSTFKGITLYTSQDGGNDFMQGCLPVAMKVGWKINRILVSMEALMCVVVNSCPCPVSHILLGYAFHC
jgi:hypothetical protein